MTFSWLLFSLKFFIIFNIFSGCQNLTQTQNPYIVKYISDFQVNENVGNIYASQINPDIASDSDGNFTVVWEDERNGKSEIYFQQFTNQGIPIGSNIKLDTDNNFRSYPSIVMNGEGEFIISCFANVKEDSAVISLQRFSSDASIKGKSIEISSKRVFNSPSLCLDNSGNFLIGWIESDTVAGVRIMVQSFSKNGTEISSQTVVSDVENLGYLEIATTMDNTSEFILAWTSYYAGGERALFYQKFDKEMNALADKVNVIDSNTFNSQPGYPDVSVDSNGNIVVIWADRNNLFSQRYSNEGEKLNSNFTVSTNSLDFAVYFPSVSHLSNNEYVVSWSKSGSLNSNVNFQRFTKNGNRIGAITRVNESDDSTYNSQPSLTTNFDGSFTIAWELGEFINQNYNSDIYVKKFNAENDFVFNQIKINDDDGLPKADQGSSCIGIDDEGNFVVVWEDERRGSKDIYAQRFLETGKRIGNNFRVNDALSHNFNSPEIAVSNNGEFLIWWESCNYQRCEIIGQFFSADGSPIGENTVLNSSPKNYSGYQTKVVVDELGNYIYSWSEIIESDYLNRRLFFKKFTREGTLLIDKKIIDDNPGGFYQFNQSMVTLAYGNFVVSWIEQLDEYISNIYYQMFSGDGDRIGLRVNIDMTQDSSNFYHLEIMSPDKNKFQIIWTETKNSDDFTLSIQKYFIDGDLNGSVITKNFSEVYSYDLIPGENGKFLFISYQSDFDFPNQYALRFDQEGNIIDDFFRLTNSTNNSGNRYNVKLKGDKIYNTWTEDRTNDNDKDVWANVLDWNNPVGIVKNNSTITKSFFLSQNYPNPFNPSTTIKYWIPNAISDFILRDVSLKIYDLLGREVTTLVNLKQKPGNYEVTWKADNQSNGIYFYRIKAGDYVRTKKMILLK